MPTGTHNGGIFAPDGDYTLSGTMTNGTFATPTITSPTISSPTITGTTSIASGATLTSPTITGPTITAGTINAANTISGNIESDTKVLAASATYTSTTTAATITGFSWTVIAAGTYAFEAELFTTLTTVGGLTVAFALTTATLTSIQYATYASTAADATTAVSTQGTTTTTATKIFDSKTAAYTRVRVYGSMVVNAGGTFAFTGTQNTSAGGGDVSVILLGSYAKMLRVA